MKRTFAYGAATNQGSWPVQEDGYFADPGLGLFALADGFGGRGAGDLAAKLVLQEVRNHPAGERGAQEGGPFSPAQRAHRELFGELNLKLGQWNEKRAPAARGGCSLLLATVEKGNQLAVTGVGAGSAFLVRAGVWHPLLSPQSAPRRDLTAPLFPAQALGMGRELVPESRSFVWFEGDLLVLFSSGLTWESDGFTADLSARMAIRVPGSDLRDFVSAAAQGSEGALAPWNRTVLAVEALADSARF